MRAERGERTAAPAARPRSGEADSRAPATVRNSRQLRPGVMPAAVDRGSVLSRS